MVAHSMMKSLTTLTAAATVAIALTAAPSDAFAQRYYRGGGAAIGLGILGGVSAGAATRPGYAGYRVAAPNSRWQSRPVRFTGAGPGATQAGQVRAQLMYT